MRTKGEKFAIVWLDSSRTSGFFSDNTCFPSHVTCAMSPELTSYIITMNGSVNGCFVYLCIGTERVWSRHGLHGQARLHRVLGLHGATRTLGSCTLQALSAIEYNLYPYCISRKSCPILYSNFLYEMGQDFLDRQYTLLLTVSILSNSVRQTYYKECPVQTNSIFSKLVCTNRNL